MALTREVSEEKNRLLVELGTLYSHGALKDKDLRSLVGKEIAEEMKTIKKIAERSMGDGARIAKALKAKKSL